jgi:hypothetical protein
VYTHKFSKIVPHGSTPQHQQATVALGEFSSSNFTQKVYIEKNVIEKKLDPSF